jgi:hypothetical protein
MVRLLTLNIAGGRLQRLVRPLFVALGCLCYLEPKKIKINIISTAKMGRSQPTALQLPVKTAPTNKNPTRAVRQPQPAIYSSASNIDLPYDLSFIV